MMEIRLIKRGLLSAVSWIPSDYTLYGCSSSVRPQTSQGFIASKVKSIIPPPPHTPSTFTSDIVPDRLHTSLSTSIDGKGRGVFEKRLWLGFQSVSVPSFRRGIFLPGLLIHPQSGFLSCFLNDVNILVTQWQTESLKYWSFGLEDEESLLGRFTCFY